MLDDRGFLVAEVFGRLVSCGMLDYTEALTVLTLSAVARGEHDGDHTQAEATAARMLATSVTIHERAIGDRIRAEIEPLIKLRAKPDILEAVAHVVNARHPYPLPEHVVRAVCIEEVKNAVRRAAPRG